MSLAALFSTQRMAFCRRIIPSLRRVQQARGRCVLCEAQAAGPEGVCADHNGTLLMLLFFLSFPSSTAAAGPAMHFVAG